MLNFRNTLKTLGAAAVLSLGALSLSAPASAQASLNEIANRIKQDSSQLNAENQARLRRFQGARAQQASIMAEARQELNAAEARSRTLSVQFDRNEARLSELEDTLKEEAGDFDELLGQFRQAAQETSPIIKKSLSNFHYTNRIEELAAISQARSLPSRADLDKLPRAMLQEMLAQSEVTTFDAEVSNAGPDGENAKLELLRIGNFTAATVDGARFVEVDEKSGRLVVFAKQPSGTFQGAMASLINASDGQVVRAPVDPSRGDLLAVFGNTLGVWNLERARQGGPVGFVILAILLPIGIAIALFKIVSLFLMGNSMRSTAKTKTAGTGNPLARVFETYEQHRNDDLETLELKLDEQILGETPKIERFNDIVKLLAAVAPLLGLLGTVVGMIVVFTAITNFGTGDPKIMAGGISQALVTTVAGLVAAIPLLLLGAIASTMARGNQQILDEQAAGLVAERSERGDNGVAA